VLVTAGGSISLQPAFEPIHAAATIDKLAVTPYFMK